MSGRSARSIRNFSLELAQDLVLLDIRKSTFQHLTVNWNLNVIEMALKTLHFVQGPSRTPLLFIPVTKLIQRIRANSKRRMTSPHPAPPPPKKKQFFETCLGGLGVWKVRGKIIRVDLGFGIFGFW